MRKIEYHAVMVDYVKQHFPICGQRNFKQFNFFLVEFINERKCLFITHLVAKNLIIFDSSSGAFSTFRIHIISL